MRGFRSYLQEASRNFQQLLRSSEGERCLWKQNYSVIKMRRVKTDTRDVLRKGGVAGKLPRRSRFTRTPA